MNHIRQLSWWSIQIAELTDWYIAQGYSKAFSTKASLGGRAQGGSSWETAQRNVTSR